MLCEKCKIREANLQYTEIINDIKREHHFCLQCAKDLDYAPKALFDSDLPLAKLLSSLLSETIASKGNDSAGIVCPTCNTTYEDFVANSRFGCKDCYEVFGLLIDGNIKQLQGSDMHNGKRPKIMASSKVNNIDIEPSLNAKDNVEELRRLLDIAIKDEEYEKAAEYRDKIKKMIEGE